LKPVQVVQNGALKLTTLIAFVGPHTISVEDFFWRKPSTRGCTHATMLQILAKHLLVELTAFGR
jgi:hypothetical protein